jgi:hypothetical protein
MICRIAIVSMAAFGSLSCLTATGGAGGAGGAGSSGSSGESGAATFAGLFAESPRAPSPGKIGGLWGGQTKAPTNPDFEFDFRYEFRPTRLTAANRCSYKGQQGPTAGVAVLARISEQEITVLENKKDEQALSGVTCSVAPPAIVIPACPQTGAPSQCFKLAGTELTIVGDTEFSTLKLTKIRD